MAYDLGPQNSTMPGFDLRFFGDAPVCYHCHHFNLFLDQTIDDAVGTQAGIALRTRAAHDAARQLLEGLSRRMGATTPPERIQLAQLAFAAMGHGTLELDATSDGGAARGSFLHYAHSWTEKYGDLVRRRYPCDAFAAGYATAAIEVAFDREAGSLAGEEVGCLCLREPGCSFEVKAANGVVPGTVSDRHHAESMAKQRLVGRYESQIDPIVDGLNGFLATAGSDERGLVQAFGVFVTLHLANYYNRLSYDAVEHTRARHLGLLPVLEGLLRESGHVCVFHTFGGILLSPEWEGMVGAPRGDVEEHVIGCTAIARALGFGHWTIEELDPDRRLVLRAPATYESAHFANGRATAASSYFFQGAAAAFMELAHRVPWTENPRLSDDFYRALFKSGATWVAEQTQDVAKGDPLCEIVVSRASS